MSAKAVVIDPAQEGQVLELRPPLFDADAVARAEAALRSFSGSFQQWLDEEIDKVHAARTAAHQLGWSTSAIDALHAAAHDLKGLGATYDCPLAGQIAASLCRLLDSETGRRSLDANPGLADAHVDALRAILREGVKTDEHPLGRALLQALADEVAAA